MSRFLKVSCALKEVKKNTKTYIGISIENDT